MCEIKKFEFKASHEELLISEKFLNHYSSNKNTHNSYKSTIYRLLLWAKNVRQEKINNLKSADIEKFIEFCKKPPDSWIANETYKKNHTCWRPFSLNLKNSESNKFSISNETVKHIFRVLGSFYQYMQQEGLIAYNPVLQIRQKKKFFFSNHDSIEIRRLSQMQINSVLTYLREKADEDPKKEKNLFIFSLVYGLYLRICELTCRFGWEPKMNSFHKDLEGKVWFRVLGKGSKFRDIAVSPMVLNSLARYRKSLGLSDFPAPDEEKPLFLGEKTKKIIMDTRYFSRIIKESFEKTSIILVNKSMLLDAQLLRIATPHWLRHTGISEDVKVRPREHVRDDAGHSSSLITDRYIDIEKHDRHASAQNRIAW